MGFSGTPTELLPKGLGRCHFASDTWILTMCVLDGFGESLPVCVEMPCIVFNLASISGESCLGLNL